MTHQSTFWLSPVNQPNGEQKYPKGSPAPVTARHTSDVHRCPVCLQRFLTRPELDRHMQRHWEANRR